MASTAEAEAVPSSSAAAAAAGDVLYCCRRCRAPLCRGSQVAAHVPGAHAFAAHRAAKDARAGHGGTATAAAVDDAAAAAACTSLFLTEPVQWMAATAGAASAEGKLACPGPGGAGGCGARLGVLKWMGSQCSCGTWVTPAIQLSKKALDSRWLPAQAQSAQAQAQALPAHAVAVPSASLPP